MFETWQIKEHMEVTDAVGRHVGAVDSLDHGIIKLTRADSVDGRHHFVDMECVDRVENDRIYLKAGVPLPEGMVGDGDAALSADSLAAGYGGQRPGAETPENDTPLFGTSGHGTGMGGSGPT